MDFEINEPEVLSFLDPIDGLLLDSKGHVHNALTIADLKNGPQKLWALNGPKLGTPAAPDTVCDAVCGAVYWVHKDLILKNDKLLKHFECLVLEPAGLPGQWTPRIKCYYEHSEKKDLVGLPRFFGLSMFGAPHRDIRSDGHPILHETRADTLRDYQPKAVKDTLKMLQEWGGATIIADCGFGKTRVGLSIAANLKRRTLLLCNREVLMLQWAAVVKDLQPEWTISWLQGSDNWHRKQIKVDSQIFLGPAELSDVCVASIDTLVEGRVPKEFLSTFGLVLVDEAHHLAAATLVHALPLLPSKNIVALSATPDRRDGLEHAIYWLAGPVSFVYKRLPSITGLHGSVNVLKVTATGCSQHEKMYNNGQLAFAEMTTSLSLDDKRNDYILKQIDQVLGSGARKKIIVVSALVNHCKALMDSVALRAPGILMAIMAGPTVESIKAKDPNTKIVFATYSMLEEGYDDPVLDTLILATPRTRVQQTVGRIERTLQGKLVPLVIDIVDPFSIYPNMWFKRAHFYKSRGFQIDSV